MKKLLLMIMIAMLCGIGIARADEVSVGLETDIMFEREYNLDGVGEIELESQTYVLTPTYALEEVAIIGKIGVTNASTDVKGIAIDTSPGLAIGLGAEGKIYDLNEDMALYGVASYLFKNLEINEVAGQEFPLRNDVDLHEWELGVMMDCDILPLEIPLVPYGGLVWNIGYGSVEDTFGNSVDLDADTNIGLRLGLKSKINEDWSAKIEGAIIDQESLTVAGLYKF